MRRKVLFHKRKVLFHKMEKIVQLLADPKIKIILIAGLIIISSIIYFGVKNPQIENATVVSQTSSPSPQTPAPEIDAEILKNALNLYIDKRAESIDLKDGPCLGKIAEDWVLDIAHRPRTAVDDLPENQCADFREGRAHHFIELDPDGQLIRSF